MGRLIEKPFICKRHECSCCDFVPTSAECVFCKEIARIVAKIGEANDTAVTCVSGHPRFEGMCLSVWVLQAAYLQYRHEHGSLSSPNAGQYCKSNVDIWGGYNIVVYQYIVNF